MRSQEEDDRAGMTRGTREPPHSVARPTGFEDSPGHLMPPGAGSWGFPTFPTPPQSSSQGPFGGNPFASELETGLPSSDPLQERRPEAGSFLTIHEGVGCDLCTVRPIRGIRYKCVQCVDADFCAGCRLKHAHSAFLMLTTPTHEEWHIPLKAVTAPLWGSLDAGVQPPDLSAPPPPEVQDLVARVDPAVAQYAVAAQNALLDLEKKSELRAKEVAMHEEEAKSSFTLNRSFYHRVPVNGPVSDQGIKFRPKVYRPGSGVALCLVARSDGKPVACVQIVAQGRNTGCTATMGNSTGARAGYFHALLSAEGAEFSFVLTNLCPVGRLRIVLKPCDGNGAPSANRLPINGVAGCVLGPLESREVLADAATGRALTLAAATMGAEGSTMAVADATTDVGSYVAVNVSVESSVDSAHTCHRLEGGVHWRLLDLFCGALPPSAHERRRAPREEGVVFGGGGFGGGGFGGGESGGSVFGAQATPSFAPSPAFGFGAPPASGSGGSGAPPDRLTGMVDNATVANIAPGRPMAFQPAFGNTPVLAAPRSQILPAVLGFAVQPHLQLMTEPCAGGLQQRAQAIVEQGLGHDMPEDVGETFVSDRCVLCLESTPKPDCVLYPCAHQCVHAEEVSAIDTCPLCRTHITATLVVDAETGRATRGPSRAPLQVSAATLHRARQSSFFKPVVYLYPPVAINASVQVELLAGQHFTCLLPDPRAGAKVGGVVGSLASWSVRAAPDGTLSHPGGAWPPVASLFWESDRGDAGNRLRAWQASDCACVHSDCVGTWLLNVLPGQGLFPREYTEMATFWAAKAIELGMPYVLTRFLGAKEIETLSALRISPAPDDTLRVYLALAPAAHPPAGCVPVRGAAQTHEVPRDSTSFTAVEWGGILTTVEAMTE